MPPPCTKTNIFNSSLTQEHYKGEATALERNVLGMDMILASHYCGVCMNIQMYQIKNSTTYFSIYSDASFIQSHCAKFLVLFTIHLIVQIKRVSYYMHSNIKLEKRWINIVYSTLKNISFIWKCHHCSGKGLGGAKSKWHWETILQQETINFTSAYFFAIFFPLK